MNNDFVFDHYYWNILHYFCNKIIACHLKFFIRLKSLK